MWWRFCGSKRLDILAGAVMARVAMNPVMRSERRMLWQLWRWLGLQMCFSRIAGGCLQTEGFSSLCVQDRVPRREGKELWIYYQPRYVILSLVWRDITGSASRQEKRLSVSRDIDRQRSCFDDTIRT